MRETKTRNFQRGSTGRSAADKAITFKVRTPTRTTAYNVRCGDKRDSPACERALDLMRKVQHDLSRVQTDEGKVRRIVKK